MLSQTRRRPDEHNSHVRIYRSDPNHGHSFSRDRRSHFARRGSALSAWRRRERASVRDCRVTMTTAFVVRRRQAPQHLPLACRSGNVQERSRLSRLVRMNSSARLPEHRSHHQCRNQHTDPEKTGVPEMRGHVGASLMSVRAAIRELGSADEGRLRHTHDLVRLTIEYRLEHP